MTWRVTQYLLNEHDDGAMTAGSLMAVGVPLRLMGVCCPHSREKGASGALGKEAWCEREEDEVLCEGMSYGVTFQRKCLYFS